MTGPVWLFPARVARAADGRFDERPVFAATVAELEPLIAASRSVTEVMTAPGAVTGIDRVQLTIFAMQVASWQPRWRHIECAAVDRPPMGEVGHG